MTFAHHTTADIPFKLILISERVRSVEYFSRFLSSFLVDQIVLSEDNADKIMMLSGSFDPSSDEGGM